MRGARRLALLTDLAFEEAVIVHDRDGLAEIEIHLRSSLRLLWVGLQWERGQTTVKTLIDGPADDPTAPQHAAATSRPRSELVSLE